MEKKVIVDGHTVVYDESLHAGIYYLINQLDSEQKRVFFDQAYNHGHAPFEDHLGYKFNLVHHGSEYQLVKA